MLDEATKRHRSDHQAQIVRGVQWSSIVVLVGALLAVVFVLGFMLLAARSVERLRAIERASMQTQSGVYRLRLSGRSLISSRQSFRVAAEDWKNASLAFEASFAQLRKLTEDTDFGCHRSRERVLADWQTVQEEARNVYDAIDDLRSDALSEALGDHGVEQTLQRLVNIPNQQAAVSRLRKVIHSFESFDIAAQNLAVEMTSFGSIMEEAAKRSSDRMIVGALILVAVFFGSGAIFLVHLKFLNDRLYVEAKVRQDAESRVRSREARLESILGNLTEAVLVLDPLQIVVWLNPAAEKLTACPADKAIGLPVSEVCPMDHGSSSNAGESTDQFIRSRDGRRHLIEHHSSVLPEGLGILVLREIGERRAMEERLRQAQTMESIGRMAGGIAHDFNNLLTGILGGCDLLSPSMKERPSERSHLDLIITSAQRAATITRQLLDFSRRSVMTPGPVDMHQIVQEAVSLLRHSFPKNITIDLGLQAKSWWVHGDASHLESAIINLALNARDAMPSGGILRITSENTADSQGIYLRIADTGTGIDPILLERIWEPFYTTKEQGRGTGLGLAAVRATIERHEGNIGVESTLRAGTVFTIFLPVCKPPQEGRRISEGQSGVITALGSKVPRILVVDDEELVRTIAAEGLKRKCYEVLSACNGLEGCKILEAEQKAGRQVDLVLLDLVMPVLDGREAFVRMRNMVPDQRILLWSGYTAGQGIDHLLATGRVGFINKPASLSTLNQAVAKLLSDS